MVVTFLIKDFSEKRRRNRAYSLRSYARHLGMHSGVLSAILNRKRPLTFKTGKRLIESLDIDISTKQKLIDSFVETSQSSAAFHELKHDEVEVLGNWEYFAIISLLETKGFRYTPEKVAARLGLTRAVVIEGIALLKRVGLLSEKNGRILPTHKNITTTHDIPSLALRRIHRQTIEKALDALEQQSVEQRDFSGMTMAIAPNKLPKAKELIRKFRRQMSALLETNEQTEVYRLNIQLYSLEEQTKEKS